MQNASGLFTGQGTVGGGASSLNGYLQGNGTVRRDAHAGRADPNRHLRRTGHFPRRRRIQRSWWARTTDSGNIIPVVNQIEYGIGLEFVPDGAVAWAHQPQDPHFRLRTRRRRVPSRWRARTCSRCARGLPTPPVELPSGGSMMIAGLVNDEHAGQPERPARPLEPAMLGTLFRSREFVRNETELVISGGRLTWHSPWHANELARPERQFLAGQGDGGGLFPGPRQPCLRNDGDRPSTRSLPWRRRLHLTSDRGLWGTWRSSSIAWGSLHRSHRAGGRPVLAGCANTNSVVVGGMPDDYRTQTIRSSSVSRCERSIFPGRLFRSARETVSRRPLSMASWPATTQSAQPPWSG